MRNMESVILAQNIQILNSNKEYFGCNCRVRNECPLDSKHLTLCMKQKFLMKPTMNVKDI